MDDEKTFLCNKRNGYQADEQICNNNNIQNNMQSDSKEKDNNDKS